MSKVRSPRPLVGVICCTRAPADDPVQGVAERYLRAATFFDADIVLIPAMPDLVDAERLLQRLDGVLLTGSPSNVQPRLYGHPGPGEGPFDPSRDGVTQALIEVAARHDKPLLGICRGFQEVAVAFGASLRHDLGAAARAQIHHGEGELSIAETFALRHRVDLSPGGVLERGLGAQSIIVNSAHYQGIDRLGPGLVVEATSHDGIVEAVRPASGDKVLAVQWHPEWQAEHDAASRALFSMFASLLRGASYDEAAAAAAAAASAAAASAAPARVGVG